MSSDRAHAVAAAALDTDTVIASLDVPDDSGLLTDGLHEVLDGLPVLYGWRMNVADADWRLRGCAAEAFELTVIERLVLTDGATRAGASR